MSAELGHAVARDHNYMGSPVLLGFVEFNLPWLG